MQKFPPLLIPSHAPFNESRETATQFKEAYFRENSFREKFPTRTTFLTLLPPLNIPFPGVFNSSKTPNVILKLKKKFFIQSRDRNAIRWIIIYKPNLFSNIHLYSNHELNNILHKNTSANVQIYRYTRIYVDNLRINVALSKIKIKQILSYIELQRSLFTQPGLSKNTPLGDISTYMISSLAYLSQSIFTKKYNHTPRSDTSEGYICFVTELTRA